MIALLIIVLFIPWLAGFALGIGGALIHILLVVALAVIVIGVLKGRAP